ncbi:MAG: hypothetical protein AAF487_12195 [Bacteroidota bacterium]
MKKISSILLALMLFGLSFGQEDQNFNMSDEESAEFEKQMMEALEQMMSSTAELQDAYKFNGMVTLKTESDGEEPMTMELWMGSDGNFGMSGLPGQEAENAFVVYDKNQSAMFMFMEEQGQKFAMSMGMPGGMAGKEVKSKEIELEKGKKKKKILDYKCVEYRLDSPYKKVTYWITQEKSNELKSIQDLMINMELFNDAEHLTEYGVILGMETENLLMESSSSNEVVALDNMANFVFYASDYELMSLKELMEMEKSMMETPQD